MAALAEFETAEPASARTRCIWRVALDVPLRRLFDYLPPAGCETALPGARVRVPFGRRERNGVLIEVTYESHIDPASLKRALACVDAQPLWSPALFSLMLWAASYYHHPLGEVLAAALPAALRTRATAPRCEEHAYTVTEKGRAAVNAWARRAPRQKALLETLLSVGHPLGAAELNNRLVGWRPAMRGLVAHGFVEGVPASSAIPAPACAPPSLNDAQRAAVEAISARLGTFAPFLLHGVTGSGKTEVYLRVIEAAIASGAQALLLVPEIGLTAQTTARFTERFGARVAVLHSALAATERARAHALARSGEAAVVIGTRSAVWTPFARTGVIVVDEEHDLSYKQQDGFRYSARDAAVMRAHRERVPVVLGSATPSLETLHNVAGGRYQMLTLPERPGTARLPELRIIDIRNRPLESGMSEPLLTRIAATVACGEQVLVFLNRRGYAPTLLCHACGEVVTCKRCDVRMTYHRGPEQLVCHHCGAERAMPRACDACASADLLALGQGTERVTETLRQRFGEHAVVRIDRDATRRKGALDAALAGARAGNVPILVGTQMLTKGHHLPGVSLVAVIDADSQLFSADMRASERLAQLVIQVAGRAGRGDTEGTVLIQTHHPRHTLFEQLLVSGYEGVSNALLRERLAAGLPPHAYLALWRAEATAPEPPLSFLEALAEHAAGCNHDGLDILGPVPAPVARRAGRYRAQLLVRSARRDALHALLDTLVARAEVEPLARRVRWSLDVDPMELC